MASQGKGAAGKKGHPDDLLFPLTPVLFPPSLCRLPSPSAGDCWQEEARDAGGLLVPSVMRCPASIKSLADILHARGL